MPYFGYHVDKARDSQETLTLSTCFAEPTARTRFLHMTIHFVQYNIIYCTIQLYKKQTNKIIHPNQVQAMT